eukprot:COSAG01_NODE_3568_length_5925_cov_4.034844_7_plen_76_part_00
MMWYSPTLLLTLAILGSQLLQRKHRVVSITLVSTRLLRITLLFVHHAWLYCRRLHYPQIRSHKSGKCNRSACDRL